MLIHKELLNTVAQEGKHTFISTGMSTHIDIQYAVDTFTKYDCSFELMHTISTYPMKDEDANLRMISTLKQFFIYQLTLAIPLFRYKNQKIFDIFFWTISLCL